MAEADNKATTSRFLTLPQAAELMGREELEFALEEGRLHATADRQTWARCEELRLGFGFHRPPEADYDASTQSVAELRSQKKAGGVGLPMAASTGRPERLLGDY